MKSILNENETEVATKVHASDCHFQTTSQLDIPDKGSTFVKITAAAFSLVGCYSV